MAEQRPVGRASVTRVTGRVRRDRIPKSRAPRTHAERTSVMSVPAVPPPVFVDDSGRRHRRLRAALYLLASVIIIAAITVWLSVSATPVHPAPVSTCATAAPAAPPGCLR